MNIKDAIKNLQEAQKAGTKNIVFAWWASEMFYYEDNEEWEVICDRLDYKMDWSKAHETIEDCIDMGSYGDDTYDEH